MSREKTIDLGRASIFGRRLEEEDVDLDYQGRIGPLTSASKNVLKFVRRHAEEIPDKDLVRQDDGAFVHRKTGTRYEVVTAFVDWPLIGSGDEGTGVTAFATRGSLIVPLRISGRMPKIKTLIVGSVAGRKGRQDDPLPVEGPVIF
jgi:hypothetical protein